MALSFLRRKPASSTLPHPDRGGWSPDLQHPGLVHLYIGQNRGVRCAPMRACHGVIGRPTPSICQEYDPPHDPLGHALLRDLRPPWCIMWWPPPKWAKGCNIQSVTCPWRGAAYRASSRPRVRDQPLHDVIARDEVPEVPLARYQPLAWLRGEASRLAMRCSSIGISAGSIASTATPPPSDHSGRWLIVYDLSPKAPPSASAQRRTKNTVFPALPDGTTACSTLAGRNIPVPAMYFL